MAPYLDYDALRAQAISTGSDEAVTVNTRALIDKVLARYSGEWTTLRELLQNAADASAKRVTIRFETIPSATVAVPKSEDPSTRIKHVLLHHRLKSSIIENDGIPFAATDWARLKKIAEGNPDETKIGAFGVGFYSVFADCEEPFVSSGKEALAFYWKGDALFTKRLQLGQTQSTNTTFILPMRNATSPVPQLLSLCQFLASSLTFVGLESIELWLDEWKILRLDKVTAPSHGLEIPTSIDRKTRNGLMRIENVTKEAAQIHATWLKVVEWKRSVSNAVEPSTKGAHATPTLRSFFSKMAPGISNASAERAAKEELALQAAIVDDLMGEFRATIFLHVNRASVRTTVSPQFSSELERATKKPPPKATAVSLLSASYDEYMASESSMSGRERSTADIFTSVIPTKGRIFIGFPTNQTTGLQAHISTPSVIPTVERESIDLNNRFIRDWNVELLRVAGIVARLSWNHEMSSLKDKLLRAEDRNSHREVKAEQVSAGTAEALFLHQIFTWNESTPASEVGRLVEEAFWTCSQQMSIDVLSSRGVLPSSRVRCLTEDLGFVQGIPVLPEALITTGLVKRLREYGVITDITISDIKSELESRPLNSDQLHHFLAWVGTKARMSEIDSSMVQSLLNVAVVNDTGPRNRVIVLNQIRTFLNPSKIPAELPIPPYTMPFELTKSVARVDLEAIGWRDLEIVPWLKYLFEQRGGKGDLPLENDLTQSPSFASSIIPVLSKQWDGLSSSSKATVVNLMTSQTTLPTKLGMRKPAEAYFPSVKLFEDLPVIVGLHSVKEKVLTAFGVRKTVDIGVVFDRLMAPQAAKGEETSSWSHVDLIKYLASVRQHIPDDDIQRLKTTAICSAEKSSSTSNSTNRYLVSQLFEPDDALRRLRLPILQWPAPYRAGSNEGKLLTFLGLKSAPSYAELVEIMASAAASGDLGLRDQALGYLINQFQLKGYSHFNTSSVETPYLPIQGSEKRVQIPRRCFLNERNAILGFDILKRELHPHASKFGVQINPPISECVDLLMKNPPRSHRDARDVFQYFTGRVTELDINDVARLGRAAIVPMTKSVKSEKPDSADSVRHVAPTLCFLGGEDKYADIFDYVDFGQDANVFLLKCGAKHEPNTLELAAKVVREPARVYTLLETPRYLELLRNLATSWPMLKKNKVLVKEMKNAPFLLGYRELTSKTSQQSDATDGLLSDDEDDEIVRTPELATASRITVVNDMITYAQFREHLIAAPMEEVLEDFYISLGSSELGDLLEQQHTIGKPTGDQSQAAKLHRLVVERTRLYLYDQPRDNISHDAKWVEKNLSFVFVGAISLKKSLKGTNLRHSQAKSAVVSYDRQAGFVMCLTPRLDYFEIAQGLIGLLLKRSKTQQTMMLEQLLETSLHKLRARGYNVERILRQKANEARMAEEQRQKQLEQEQLEIKEQERAWRDARPQTAQERERSLMPGDFPESPDSKRPSQGNQPQTEEPVHRSRSLFAKIGRSLGIDDRGKAPQQDPPMEQNIKNTPDDAPPPYSQQDAVKQPQTPAPQPETVTAPHRLQKNLLNAIQASRPHNSNTLASAPEITNVKETHSYCDSKPAQDISYVSETSTTPPIRIFLSKDVLSAPHNLTPQKFLAANASAINAFAGVLLDCADIFKLRRTSVHIFYDASGSTIAFNQNKALFFNYRYFENLHLEKVQQKSKSDAVVYWSVVMAHELAHNIVADHSANHSYYTESLVVQFFPAVAAKVATLGPSSDSAPPLPADPLRARARPVAAENQLVDVD